MGTRVHPSGLIVEDAPVGSQAWAERVRRHMTEAMDGTFAVYKKLADYVKLIEEHQAWTLMSRDDGTFFRSFEEFCEYRQPWGLGMKVEKIRTIVALVERFQAPAK